MAWLMIATLVMVQKSGKPVEIDKNYVTDGKYLPHQLRQDFWTINNTPPKINMEPENLVVWGQCFSFSTVIFSGSSRSL